MSLSPQSRDPQLLCPCVRRLYIAMLHDVETHHQMQVTLVETLREIDRQAYYIRRGLSASLNSLHLAQPPRGLALAFDLAPTLYLGERGWNPEGSLWRQLGESGESLGLEWGGRWLSFHDAPHFQLRKCQC